MEVPAARRSRVSSRAFGSTMWSAVKSADARKQALAGIIFGLGMALGAANFIRWPFWPVSTIGTVSSPLTSGSPRECWHYARCRVEILATFAGTSA